MIDIFFHGTDVSLLATRLRPAAAITSAIDISLEIRLRYRRASAVRHSFAAIVTDFVSSSPARASDDTYTLRHCRPSPILITFRQRYASSIIALR